MTKDSYQFLINVVNAKKGDKINYHQNVLQHKHIVLKHCLWYIKNQKYKLKHVNISEREQQKLIEKDNIRLNKYHKSLLECEKSLLECEKSLLDREQVLLENEKVVSLKISNMAKEKIEYIFD